MGFLEAINACFDKYVTFQGRARRSEFWYFTLFTCLVGFAAIGLDFASSVSLTHPSQLFSYLVTAALFLPGTAVAVRRLHDVDWSGRWVIIPLGIRATIYGIGLISWIIPRPVAYVLLFVELGLGFVLIVYTIIFIVIATREGTVGPNRFGADPVTEFDASVEGRA